MSKDGDWIIRETEEACGSVLGVLERHGATMRPSAPLDVRWLRGGWSSHFEFDDERGRRIRCDFVARPPRANPAAIDRLWSEERVLNVIDPDLLARIKQTQRAKDYAVIGAVARLLDPQGEIALTTDPDRIIELAGNDGLQSDRGAVRAAREKAGRDAVVVELALEIDRLQQTDRRRVKRYEEASGRYLGEFRRLRLMERPLPEAHERSVELAASLLPRHSLEESDGDAQ